MQNESQAMFNIKPRLHTTDYNKLEKINMLRNNRK